MTPEHKIILNLVKRFSGSTALELWTRLIQVTDTPFDMRVVRTGFKEEDQSFRVELAKLEKAGKVKSRVRDGSILKEWAAA